MTKVRENRLRRKAARQGLRLVKSKRRDQDAPDFGRYWLLKGPGEPHNGLAIVGGEHGADLDEIEEALTARGGGR